MHLLGLAQDTMDLLSPNRQTGNRIHWLQMRIALLSERAEGVERRLPKVAAL